MHTKPIPPEVLDQLLSSDFQSRFWDKVKIAGPDECWIWQASRVSPNGYGQIGFWIGKRKWVFKSHKVAWISANKTDVPEGLLVLHSCVDCKPCCNPSHLRPGTNQENAMDMVHQGRANPARGEHGGMSKFSNSQILLMRSLYSSGGHTYVSISKLFSMSKENARSIILRETWTHI